MEWVNDKMTGLLQLADFERRCLLLMGVWVMSSANVKGMDIGSRCWEGEKADVGVRGRGVSGSERARFLGPISAGVSKDKTLGSEDSKGMSVGSRWGLVTETKGSLKARRESTEEEILETSFGGNEELCISCDTVGILGSIFTILLGNRS